MSGKIPEKIGYFNSLQNHKVILLFNHSCEKKIYNPITGAIFMKLAKKIIFAIVLLLFSGMCFAQNAEAQKALEDAKQAEGNKQWIHAVCYYLDAVELDPLNTKEARDRIKVITEAIVAGKPGPGEFNAFEMINGWKSLLLDAERYFTEVCTYAISFGPWEMSNINMKNQTADYKAKMYFRHDPRYIEMRNLLKMGYEKSFQDFWVEQGLPSLSDDHPYHANWPKTPVSKVPGIKELKDDWSNKYYSLVTNQKSYLVNGVAIVAKPEYSSNWDSSIKAYKYTEVGIKTFYNAFERGYYDASIKVIDDEGQILVQPKRILLESINNNYNRQFYENYFYSQYVEVKNITADKMYLFDKQIAKPVVDNMFLQYGYINPKDYEASTRYENPDYLAFKMKLPELSSMGRLSPDRKKHFIVGTKYDNNYYVCDKNYDEANHYIVSEFFYPINDNDFDTITNLMTNIKTVEFNDKKITYFFGTSNISEEKIAKFASINYEKDFSTEQYYVSNIAEKNDDILCSFLSTIPEEVAKYTLGEDKYKKVCVIYRITDKE